jgi:molybdate transport system substrate-binding protein
MKTIEAQGMRNGGIAMKGYGKRLAARARLAAWLAAALAVAAGLAACGGQGGAAATTATATTAATTAAAEATTAAATEAATAATAAEEEAAKGGAQGEVVVFAAASMTETLQEIAPAFEAANPGAKVTCSFESSGTLKTQIQEGAGCDLFVSAGQKQMDQLDASADPSVNTEGLDFVAEGTRVDLLENKVALCVPSGNPAGINSFEDLAARLTEGDVLFAMGNSDVPVGQYTQKILEYFGLDEAAIAAEGKITYGSNVKEVTTQIAEGSVGAGVVYCTDAFSAGLDIAATATPEMCGQVIYPAAVIKTGKNPEAARAFLEYLQSPAAMAVFESVGFSPAG